MSLCVGLQYSIRVMEVRELGDLVALYRQWLDEEGVNGSLPDFVASLKSLADPSYVIMGLWHERELAGFMDADIRAIPTVPFTIATSNYFYVSPEHRQKAGWLFRTTLTWMKAKGAKSLKMTVSDEALLTFWQKHRFEVVGLLLERSL